MNQSFKPILLFFLFIIAFMMFFPERPVAEDQGPNIIHHVLKVRLLPKEHRIEAEDLVTVSEGYQTDVFFSLHRGLSPLSKTPGVSITRESLAAENSLVETFRVRLKQGIRSFQITYGGIIDHPLQSGPKVVARGMSSTAGMITEEGVSLDANSYWYPSLPDAFVTFDLDVELPAGWDAVSQDTRTSHLKDSRKTKVSWQCTHPQEGIFLIAARFTEYERPSGGVVPMVFLRTPDSDLASKYLDATIRYIEMYDKLIGPYPYAKFALVENFWETGFGMPSFTLLGPKIIRLPFIINTSYPHEILHNWWGNSVYPDYEKGNWSEGLTAYLSDHLMKEQQGQGTDYRMSSLQKYSDYVLTGRDFPLTEFRSRESSSSEAVGYGKSLMFFHMLRLELGDGPFVKSLRHFYEKYKFHLASFEDVRKSFEETTGKDLKNDFSQWVTRTGAPSLELAECQTKKDKTGYLLTVRLLEKGKDKPYRLRVPIAVTLDGEKKAWQDVVEMDTHEAVFSFHFETRPVRVDIDPEFDVFRRLDKKETPPALSQALGAKKMLIVLPSARDGKLLSAYRELAQSLGASGPDEYQVVTDKELKDLPSDKAVVILGWENHFLERFLDSIKAYDIRLDRHYIRIDGNDISSGNNSAMFMSRNPQNEDMALTFIASDRPEALPGLGRKLPHYHKYSYLVFEGEEPSNVAKGRWPVLDSPMTRFLGPVHSKTVHPEMGSLAPRKALAELPPVFSKNNMRDTINYLASSELGGRGLDSEGIDKAAVFITEQFSKTVLKPINEKGFIEEWIEDIKDIDAGTSRNIKMKNIIGIIPGKKKEFDGQSVVIGAHYDHLGTGWPDVKKGNEGKIHPGADDNASGVAVLVELARVLSKSLSPDRTVIFAAFTGEEAGRLGSRHFLKDLKGYPPDKCIGMLNLDTVGRLGKGKLLVLGSESADEWVHIFRGVSFVTGTDITMAASGLDSSDQVSFQEAGVPAVQLFTGAHTDYHTPGDTPDKIDLDGLVKVASVAKEAIEYLASRSESLTSNLRTNEKTPEMPKKTRKTSFGTIPDYTFSGKGVRLSGVVQGSPAEACGMKEGDVITAINGKPLAGLKALSEILKTLSPGDRITVTFMREGRELIVEATLTDR